MPARQTEAQERSTTGSEPSRTPEQGSNALLADTWQGQPESDRGELSAARVIAGALMLVGVGLAVVAAGIFCTDAGRMVDLTDEGIALLQARSHDANEIVPSPFGRVTGPIFWLARHNLDAFRIAGFLILALVAATLILLVTKSLTRARVAMAFSGGIAAATMFYAEYFRTPNYNWIVAGALALVAIALVILIAPPKTVAKWQQWHRDLIAGSILGFGIALTLTARIHSAAATAIVLAVAAGAWFLRLHARGQRVRLAFIQALRVTAASMSTCALWVLFALVLPAGGLGPLRRDVRNGVDWLNANGSTSTGDLGRYPEDLREFFAAIFRTLGQQGPGVAVGLLLATLILWAVIAVDRRRRDRHEHPVVSSTGVVSLMTAGALGGALSAALVRGDLHGGHSTTPTPAGPTLLASTLLGLALLGLVTWGVFGRLVGVVAVAFIARWVNLGSIQQLPTATPIAGDETVASSESPRPGWIFLTATLVGLALAVSVGSGNPMAYQLRYGSVLLFAALVCVASQWNRERNTVVGRPRPELPIQLLSALLCVAFGAFALRWVLDARANPYRQPSLSTTTESFRSSATGVAIQLPRSEGRGLEQLERQARRAGWQPGTSLLDLTPFHPFVTFWLGADPPFNVYPAVESVRATDSLLLTISRESADDLHDAWLLVSSPLLHDIDYSAISSALGRPWPCGYEPVGHARVGSDSIPYSVRVELLRPVASPASRTCPTTQ
jgi:hypothetical protein